MNLFAYHAKAYISSLLDLCYLHLRSRYPNRIGGCNQVSCHVVDELKLLPMWAEVKLEWFLRVLSLRNPFWCKLHITCPGVFMRRRSPL